MEFTPEISTYSSLLTLVPELNTLLKCRDGVKDLGRSLVLAGTFTLLLCNGPEKARRED